MSSTLYLSDLVVPVCAAPFADGGLLIRDGRIVTLGSRQELIAQDADAQIVDFGAAILMPPLVNAHCHLELTDFPAWQQQAPTGGFVDWIVELIKTKHALDPDQLKQSVCNGLKSLLKTGTGAVCDILSIATLDAEYADSPLHGWLCYELIGLDEGMGQVLPMMAADFLDAAPLKSLHRGLSPHSPYTVGPQGLRRLQQLATERQVMMTMHAGESPEESAFLLESAGAIADQLYPLVGWHKPMPPYGYDSISFIEKGEALHGGNLLVHGVQCDADAIARIGRSGCSVVLCPRSNDRLGVGRAPVESYLCQGVNLALGTDSMASNDSLSLWDEIAFARRQYGETLSSVQLLAMATVNGARALGITDRIGSFTAGSGANFQVLRPQSLPELVDVADFLCRGERGDEVAHLYLDNVDVLVDLDNA